MRQCFIPGTSGRRGHCQPSSGATFLEGPLLCGTGSHAVPTPAEGGKKTVQPAPAHSVFPSPDTGGGRAPGPGQTPQGRDGLSLPCQGRLLPSQTPRLTTCARWTPARRRGCCTGRLAALWTRQVPAGRKSRHGLAGGASPVGKEAELTSAAQISLLGAFRRGGGAQRETLRLPGRASAVTRSLPLTHPTHNSPATDGLQGAGQAEYPPVPFPELHNFIVEVFQADAVAPLDGRQRKRAPNQRVPSAFRGQSKASPPPPPQSPKAAIRTGRLTQ